jgi:glucan phosphoethanolaminetransferase (alkaline phosphatase superfamily)
MAGEEEAPMTSIRREVGFWSTFSSFRIGQVFRASEFIWGVLLGAGGGGALLLLLTVKERVAVAADFLSLTAALLGIIFAAFALVIALFSDTYLKWLASAPDGVRGFLAPFMFAIGVQVGALLLTVGYRAAAQHVPTQIERGAWVLLAFAFCYSLLNVVALARSVMAHGLTRARSAELGSSGDSVRPLPQRKASP